MVRVLALDLGTTYGWADDKESGYIKLSSQSQQRSLDFYLSMYDKLFPKGILSSPIKNIPDLEDIGKIKVNNVKSRRNYDVVAYESASFQRGMAGQIFPKYVGILEVLTKTLSMDLVPIPVMTIKKQFTGSGKATKEDVLSAVNRRRGKHIKDHNEADAVAVYETYMGMYINK